MSLRGSRDGGIVSQIITGRNTCSEINDMFHMSELVKIK